MKDFILNQGERIIGIKSSGRGFNKALHFNFELVIGNDLTKFCLMKLFALRNSTVNSKLMNLPHGVFREIIKYIRY